MWNASEKLYRSFDNGDYVRIEGTTQLFQGASQLIATRIVRVDPREVDEADSPVYLTRLLLGGELRHQRQWFRSSPHR